MNPFLVAVLVVHISGAAMAVLSDTFGHCVVPGLPSPRGFVAEKAELFVFCSVVYGRFCFDAVYLDLSVSLEIRAVR